MARRPFRAAAPADRWKKRGAAAQEGKGAAAEDYTKKKTLTDKQKELLAKMKKKKDPAGSAV